MTLVRILRSLATAAVLSLRGVRAGRLRPLDLGPFAAALDAVTPERRQELDGLTGSATVADLQAALAGGALTAEDLTLLALDRIRRFDDELMSIIELNPDALTEARASDERRRAGAPIGPLEGIPVTLKDNIETAGPLRTTAGSIALADHVAAHDAPLVTALRAAGAVVLGKANLSELAGAVCRTPGVSAVGGATRNPYGERFSPGGSSSGSAVAVAAGLCVVSVGTETSGSLIAPAAFNGVVAIKPTHGLVDGAGIVPLVRRQDTAGAIGRCVADAAALLAAMAGDAIDADALSPLALAAESLRDVPVGVLRDDILTQKSATEDTSDNAAVLERIQDGLTRSGASPQTAAVPDDAARELDKSFAKVVLGGLSHDTIGYLAAAGVPVHRVEDLQAFNLADPRRRMPQGQFFVDVACFSDVDEATYERASEDQQLRAAAILDATFATAGTELLVSITNCHSSLYATAGYPAVTVPVGVRANGMPVGVTFIGRAGDDARLVRRAHAFEQATGWRVAPELTLDASPPSARE